MQKVFLAKVHGEYISQVNNDNRVLKNYTACFRLPNADKPLSIIRGKLLMPFLKRTDPNAIAPYSWYLDEIRPENGEFDPDEIPVTFMSMPQLAVYCKRNKIQIPLERYTDLELARAHVELAKNDPASFKIVFERYAKTMDEDRALAELNKDFEGIGEVGPEIDVDTKTGAAIPKRGPGRPPKSPTAPTAVPEDDLLS